MWKQLILGLAILALVGWGLGASRSHAAQASTVELVLEEGLNGYTGTRDNTIYQESLNTNGAGQHLFAGANAGQQARRALIAFDLKAIPARSKIVAVSLRLMVSRTQAESSTQSLHRLTKDWGEGTQHAGGNEGGGIAPMKGDATWQSNFHEVSRWTEPGAKGDFIDKASASAEVGSAGNLVTWSSEQIIADVQAWVNDPATNFGWILIGDEASSQTAKRFFSSDNKDLPEGQRPRLVVKYTPP